MRKFPLNLLSAMFGTMCQVEDGGGGPQETTSLHDDGHISTLFVHSSQILSLLVHIHSRSRRMHILVETLPLAW